MAEETADKMADTTTTITTAADANAPLPSPIFTTPRLIIRPMHPQDAPSMHRACEPASITKYMTLMWPSPYTLAHATEWIRTNTTENLPKYVITLRSDPTTVIGSVGLKPGRDVWSHTADMGYWLGEDYWGKGYMSEAVQGLTDWVFGGGWAEAEKAGGCRKLCAGVCGGNEGSAAVLRKCGYREEGCQRGMVEKRGEVRDLYLFGLLKSEWEEMRRGKRE